MGFGCNRWGTIWSIEPSSTGLSTKVRLSTSKKKNGGYEQDFSGFCFLIGEAHKKAKDLNVRDRIKILDCEDTSFYDNEKKRDYVSHKIYDFELSGSTSSSGTTSPASPQASAKRTAFDDFDIIDSDDEDDNTEESSDTPF